MLKIFNFRPRARKATLELSINAIVIIVLAMTILGLGLGFVRNQFKQIGGTGSQVQEQIKEQILEQMRTSGKKVAVQKQVSMGRRESSVVGIGVKNVGDTPVDLTLDIVFQSKKEAESSGEGDEIDFFFDPGPYTLGPTEEKVISAEISSDRQSGTYIYSVEFYDSENTLYDKQSFFVKVS